MNDNSDVQNTIIIEWCSGIEIRGEYFIITPTDCDVKVAISKQALTQITNEAIRLKRIKVVLDG